MGGKLVVIVTVGLVCYVLTGCTDKPKRSPEYEAEQLLMSDTTRAVPELIQRLHARALLRDGVLLLRDQFDASGLQALPSVPPWKAECGITGLNISFAYGSSADEHVTVNLTDVSLTGDQCAALLPPVAAEAKAYLSAPTASQGRAGSASR